MNFPYSHFLCVSEEVSQGKKIKEGKKKKRGRGGGGRGGTNHGQGLNWLALENLRKCHKNNKNNKVTLRPCGHSLVKRTDHLASLFKVIMPKTLKHYFKPSSKLMLRRRTRTLI